MAQQKKAQPKQGANHTRSSRAPQNSKRNAANTTGGRSKSRSTSGGKGSRPNMSFPSDGGSTPHLVDNKLSPEKVRASLPYNENMTLNFPQSVDLFTYSALITPCGDNTGSDSEIRTRFEDAFGVKLVTAVNRMLRASPTTAVTVDHIADYINTVTQAYAYWYSVQRHIAYCYWNGNKRNLGERLSLIYDEGIDTAHIQLANALSAHYLPPKIVSLVRHLYDIYAIDVVRDPVDFQIVPWTDGYNNVAAFTSGYSTHITNLNSITNRDTLLRAFSDYRYGDFSQLVMEAIPFSAQEMDPDSFFGDRLGRGKYDVNMLDLWSNLPLQAYSTGAVYSVVADLTTEVAQVFFGSSMSKLVNGLIPKYVTSTARNEPGVLNPAKVPSSGGDSNMKFINAAGNETEFDVRTGSTDSVILGIKARTAFNVWCTDFGVFVTPAGANHHYTSLRQKTYDMDEVVKDLMMK
jgi:hypothetical protein